MKYLLGKHNRVFLAHGDVPIFWRSDFMVLVDAEVKEYPRKRKRGDKVYETSQFQVNLKKHQGFIGGEQVLVISQGDWDKYLPGISDLKGLEDFHKANIKMKTELENNRGRISRLVDEKDKLENTYNHLKTKHERDQDRINTMEATITRLENKGLGSYLGDLIKRPFHKKSLDGDVENTESED